MASLPKIVKDVDQRFSDQATRMEGKTVKKVRFGIREDIKGVHQSDVLQLEFTDGEILAIQSGSNALNLTQDLESGSRSTIKPDDFHVDFVLIWKDTLSNKS